jgi:site-specific DNA-methyltransferase (adenine-specific)
MSRDLIVAKLGGALALLAQARDATDAKQVADLARAAEVYAKRQKLSEDAIAYATAVKVDALALMGDFLKATAKNAGTKGQLKGRDASGGRPRQPPENGAPTLKEVGISKEDSWVSQALSDIQEEDPAALEQVRSGKLSPKRAASRHRRQQRKAEAARALPPPPNGDGGPWWQITCADSRAELPRLKAAGRRFRLIPTDCVYNLGLDYGRGRKADLRPPDEYLGWCREWMGHCADLLTPDGSLWALICDEWLDHYGLLLREVGLHLRQRIVWFETFGINNPNGFNRCHRYWLWAVKDPDRFVFHPEAVNRPSDRQTKYADRRADPDGKTWDSVWGINPPIPRLTATCKERLEGFPTQLPVALLRPVIECASDPGDVILDPFSGSGTAGHAALEAGRQYLGIELNEDFAARSRRRLAGVARALADRDGHGWRPDEALRRDLALKGQTVVANMHRDRLLIDWAESVGRRVNVDRTTDWGNPMVLGVDGDRHACVQHYQQYLDMRPGLLRRIPELRGGKVLCCWCAPELCHGDVLTKLANREE